MVVKGDIVRHFQSLFAEPMEERLMLDGVVLK